MVSRDGRSVRHDDDARNECFRAYKHPKDSYRDHSKFLRSGARYAFLFRLKITDYKGWARGLKKAGYATDPQYANRLINIIELYDLDKYDHKGGLEWAEEFPNPHQPYLANELLYVVARRGDTFKSLGKEFDISHRKLRKYNELPKDYVFRGGEIVYLEEKRRRATKDHIAYVVRSGDSMYSISQKFGVRLERLYKMNNMDPDSPAPKVGDILRCKTLGYRQKTLPVSVLIYYARLKQGEFFIRMKQMLSFFRKPLCYLMYLLLFAELFVEFYYSFYSFTENVEREVLIG